MEKIISIPRTVLAKLYMMANVSVHNYHKQYCFRIKEIMANHSPFADFFNIPEIEIKEVMLSLNICEDAKILLEKYIPNKTLDKYHRFNDGILSADCEGIFIGKEAAPVGFIHKCIIFETCNYEMIVEKENNYTIIKFKII
jgi:hypothetical protein